ncbi:MAG: FAD-dependent oxidoreductase, partial [Bradyrhizobium sp.]
TFGGAVGVTVHGMPQIGQLRRGLWVASGFGRQGLNTSALAGQLIARSILWGDDRWRLFSPFELVWAGGTAGRVAGHFVGLWARGAASAAGVLARYREGARAREQAREARLAEANLKAGTRGPAPRRPPGAMVRPVPPPAPPRQSEDGEARYPHASQESERISDGRM